MRVLYVIDLQREFVKDVKGKFVYDACLKYIEDCRYLYDKVVAAVYKNTYNVNMVRYVGWEEMQQNVSDIEFRPDEAYFHSGYVIQQKPFDRFDKVDVLGFDTDACVLNACFELFNANVQFRILSEFCWSSGGEQMHKAGLLVMKRQFGKALSTTTSKE